MLIINNRFLSLYDYNFLLVIERRKLDNQNINTSGRRLGQVGYGTILQVHSTSQKGKGKE
jgi:hypothetical protein